MTRQLGKVLAWLCTLAIAFTLAPPAPAQISKPATAVEPGSGPSGEELTIWNLEHAYWRYVQDNDLRAYLNQWHKDFVGWPSMNPEPVTKDHITDWITSQTAKGLTFKSVDFKPANLQITGNLAIAYYRITYQWIDRNSEATTYVLRVTHTWIKIGNEWQIIGGMSMREPSTPK